MFPPYNGIASGILFEIYCRSFLTIKTEKHLQQTAVWQGLSNLFEIISFGESCRKKGEKPLGESRWLYQIKKGHSRKDSFPINIFNRHVLISVA